jgi:iron complex outermembrane receptor protein
MALPVALLGWDVPLGYAADNRDIERAGEAAIHVEHILVTGVRDADPRPIAGTQNVLSPQAVARFDASSGAEILRHMPAVHVPTNSRGESIVFLRNAGERQVAVFLGGAMLNVPWDNRFDMSMLPGHLVGSVLSASGPIPASYGANTLGAVNVLLPDYRGGGSFISEWGEQGAQRHEGIWSGSLNGVQVLGAGSYVGQDGEPVADRTRMPFFQSNPDRRTNTDRELLSFAGRAGFEVENGRVDATFIFSDGEKGIAPESHLASGNRFWRYPEHRLAQGNLHANIDFSQRVNLTASAWVQDFRQTIDQYTNATYSSVLDREEGEDRTYGTRGILTSRLGDRSQVALSYNLLISTHVQRDTRLVDGALPLTLQPWFTYRQRAISFGADFEHHFTDALVGELGGGVDWLAYTRTGDKPSIPDFVEPTVHGGLGLDLSDQWRLRVGAGYKTRSPTMRELFGVALNRFLLNPDLTAEHVITVEAAAEWTGANASFAAIPFAQFVDNTIDQRNVGALRQRINLRGSEIFGVEISGMMKLSEEWTVTGNLTASHVRRLRSTATESVHIAEKPALLAGLSIDYTGASGFAAGVEIDRTGRAYSANAEGTLVPLEVSTQLNVRLAFNLDRAFTVLPWSQIYARADNLTDAVVEPQLGIPAAGRWIKAGFRIRW